MQQFVLCIKACTLEYIRRWYTLFLCILLPSVATGAHYRYTPQMIEAYQQIMALDWAGAEQSLTQLQKEDPENLCLQHLLSYRAFFKIYTKDQSIGLKSFKGIRDEALKQVSKGPEDSPWHLYIQADIRLQWALLKFRYGEYFSGFWEVKRAYALLEKNQKQFPDFAPNYKDLGILKALVGTVPDAYKWGLKVLSGMSGTVVEGKVAFKKALNDQGTETTFLKAETVMLYSFLLLYLDKDNREAWQWVQDPVLTPHSNVLHAFTYASVASRAGQQKAALEVLSTAREKSNWKAFPFLEFRLAEIKLQQLDLGAKEHYEIFLRTYQGGTDIKASYLRLSWIALLQNQIIGYQRFLVAVQTEGNAESGRDQDALYMSKLDFIPSVHLIQSRLLFDGGDYSRALGILDGFQETDFATIYEKLEWNYRMGRITHQLDLPGKALRYYGVVLARGQDQPFYFACNAALQIGLIYEEQEDKIKAKSYFEQCLNLKPEIYKNSLHLAAKAALQRLKE